jgi:hypothetical protein
MPEPAPTTPAGGAIEVAGGPYVARSFETVRISGTYPDEGATALRVQRRERGEWVSFPLPFATDAAGNFNAFVELGDPGRYQLRIIAPESGATSDVFPLTIE